MSEVSEMTAKSSSTSEAAIPNDAAQRQAAVPPHINEVVDGVGALRI